MESLLVCVLTVFAVANSQFAYWNTASQSQLHPVAGLFVKPSADGSTGDLYVAATEDNGVQTQWIADKPVNFLPAVTSSQHAAGLSCPTMTPSESHDEVVDLEKQALISHPGQYAYAAAVNEAAFNPYSFIMAAMNAANSAGEAQESMATPTEIVQTQTHYMPLQFLYPNMVNTSPVDSIKESDNEEEVTTPVQKMPIWSYTYPTMQYLMMDPNSWNQNLSTAKVVNAQSVNVTTSPPETISTTADQEEDPDN